MAVTIDLRGDLREVERLLGGLSGQTKVVLFRSINRVLTPVRAVAAREMARDTKLPVRVTRRALELSRARPNHLVGSVTASGKRVSLFEFRARPVAGGVSYDTGRGRRVAEGAFIPASPPRSANTTMRAVFRRFGKSRLPLNFLRGPSLPRVFVNRQVVAAMQRVTGDRWPREVNAQIRFLLLKFGGSP